MCISLVSCLVFCFRNLCRCRPRDHAPCLEEEEEDHGTPRAGVHPMETLRRRLLRNLVTGQQRSSLLFLGAIPRRHGVVDSRGLLWHGACRDIGHGLTGCLGSTPGLCSGEASARLLSTTSGRWQSSRRRVRGRSTSPFVRLLLSCTGGHDRYYGAIRA